MLTTPRARSAKSFTSMALAAVLLPLCLSTAVAHGPVRQKAIEKITINASPAVVWGKIKNFDALKDWHPAVAESTADAANNVGSVRQVKLKGGGELTETLEGYDDAKMKYSYRAKDGGALPVSNYTSTISVTAEGSQTVVEWRGAFYRGFLNNDPPPELNDEAAMKAITGVYKSGLENLKKLVEGS
jgi:carbon monoxide dehydrogenase subunit G